MSKFNFMSVFIAALLSAQLVSAVTLKADKSDTTFEDAVILKSVTFQAGEKDSVVMNSVSHGLRKKAVFGLVPVRVYVIQFLAAHPEKLVKNDDGIIKSLKAAGPVQLYITFLRDLPGPKIADAFKEGLEANKINVKKLSLEMEQVLKEIGAITEFKKGETFSVTVDWKASQASIYLEDPKGEIKSVSGNDEFAEQFLSIWFGHPSDGKLRDLKKELLK